MQKNFLSCCLFIPLLLAIRHEPVLSAVYDWKQPNHRVQRNMKRSVLFEGSAFDMEWLQMNAVQLASSHRKIRITIPENEEHLYLIKEGALDIMLNGSLHSLMQCSTMHLMPGEELSLQNTRGSSCSYYVMRYRSKLSMDKERDRKAGGSFIKDSNTTVFRPHDKGGVRNYFERATTMMKRLEIHESTLNAGLKSHDPHTHRAEEIVVMMEGNTEMQIGEKFYKGKEGSVFFLGSNVLHAIRNEGSTPCTYFAIQFE